MSDSVSKPKRELSSIAKLYLLLYNGAQVVGWSYALYKLVSHLTTKPYTSVWDSVGPTLHIFQTAAVLEIVHTAIKIVPSSVLTTAFQVFSRVFVMWGVCEAVPEASTSIGVPLMVTAWCFAEIVRYLYYALNLQGPVPYPLQWARYTLFIGLYPLGITGELLCCLASLPYVAQRGVYTIALPNALNFTFSYYYFLIGYMFMYIPFFPKLYFYMLGQRKKMLGGETSKKSK